MKKSLISIGIFLLFGSVAQPTAAQLSVVDGVDLFAACTPNDSTMVPGGFVVTKWCDGRMVGGFGTQLTEADTNAESFGEVGSTSGTYCSLHFSSVKGFPGGYLADFWCDGRKVSGVGSNATDTGNNALGFAIYAANGGRYCSLDMSNIKAVPGGYQVRYYCGGRSVSGFGSTPTAAGQDALANVP